MKRLLMKWFIGSPIKGEPMNKETYFKTINVNRFMTFNQWSDAIYLKTIKAKP